MGRLVDRRQDGRRVSYLYESKSGEQEWRDEQEISERLKAQFLETRRKRSSRWDEKTNPRPTWALDGTPKHRPPPPLPPRPAKKTKKVDVDPSWLSERVPDGSSTYQQLADKASRVTEYDEAVCQGGMLMHGWLFHVARSLMDSRPEPLPWTRFVRLWDGTCGSFEDSRVFSGQDILILDIYLTPTQVHARLAPGSSPPPSGLPILVHLGGPPRVVRRRQVVKELLVDAVPIQYAPVCRHLMFIKAEHWPRR
jgi:hypothetical protein